ncbi:hypothetical protein DSO57_1005962 [Entomophthora muscae]|uniref:Uncharacterized protein n=1 Tax=Entomophthora muscae TaxID=34485 RepID=A0ACC2TUT9_9FUNG|nr:hypothetical protein DSO57_1005962 [Entomophthora muscae]
MKCLNLVFLLSFVSALDPPDEAPSDSSCTSWFGTKCANWMRCYINGEYSKDNTKAGCKEAGLEFNGNACWAEKRVGLRHSESKKRPARADRNNFARYRNCTSLAPINCPNSGNGDVYFKCLSD